MQKPRLAFIDHSFHKKSRSGDFLRDIFRERFDITDYWDESWHGGPTVPPEEINKHDYAFYFQSLSPARELRKIRVPILWAPMYDGIKFNFIRWKTISQFDVKVVSFSKTVSAWVKRFPIPVLEAQYYREPQTVPTREGNHLFFWYRGDVSWDNVKRVIDPAQVDSTTYFENPDPSGRIMAISDEDKAAYKMTVVAESFLPKERYAKLMEGSTIFIAPRKKEGIGMSFIEALALGKCVIGYDDATLDEYVTDGKDGVLWTEKTGRIDISRAPELAQSARKRAAQGYQKWLADRNAIAPFMLDPYHAKRSPISATFWVLVDSAAAFWRKMRYHVLVSLPKKLWNRSSPS